MAVSDSSVIVPDKPKSQIDNTITQRDTIPIPPSSDLHSMPPSKPDQVEQNERAKQENNELSFFTYIHGPEGYR